MKFLFLSAQFCTLVSQAVLNWGTFYILCWIPPELKIEEVTGKNTASNVYISMEMPGEIILNIWCPLCCRRLPQLNVQWIRSTVQSDVPLSFAKKGAVTLHYNYHQILKCPYQCFPRNWTVHNFIYICKLILNAVNILIIN
jgi:hypothetical protein